MQYRYLGCDGCTANGCFWCDVDALCVSDGAVIPAIPKLQCTAEDFVGADTCPIINDGNFFSDPFYGAAEWIYDMINVKPVWQSGISKSLLASVLWSFAPPRIMKPLDTWFVSLPFDSPNSSACLSFANLQRALASTFESTTLMGWMVTILI